MNWVLRWQVALWSLTDRKEPQGFMQCMMNLNLSKMQKMLGQRTQNRRTCMMHVSFHVSALETRPLYPHWLFILSGRTSNRIPPLDLALNLHGQGRLNIHPHSFRKRDGRSKFLLASYEHSRAHTGIRKMPLNCEDGVAALSSRCITYEGGFILTQRAVSSHFRGQSGGRGWLWFLFSYDCVLDYPETCKRSLKRYLLHALGY